VPLFRVTRHPSQKEAAELSKYANEQAPGIYAKWTFREDGRELSAVSLQLSVFDFG
jgi:hypothetical protein